MAMMLMVERGDFAMQDDAQSCRIAEASFARALEHYNAATRHAK